MGILEISHQLHKKDENIYNTLYKQYDFEKVNESCVNSGAFSKVEKKNSYYQITDFGKAFIKACSFEKIKTNANST